jgi:hypothetical protein
VGLCAVLKEILKPTLSKMYPNFTERQINTKTNKKFNVSIILTCGRCAG